MTILGSLAGSSFLNQRNNGGLPDRAPTSQANPVGNTKTAITRAPDKARILHPKLNMAPWATSYAQKRAPMHKSKSKGMRYG